MFTGLVQDIGRIVRAEHRGSASRLSIKTALDLADLQIGESIAVSGACYTVVEHTDDTFSVDVSPESLDRTTAGDLAVGDGVHLERAMRLSDRLGGHLVLGHVDGVGMVTRREQQEGTTHLRISAPTQVSTYLIPKGCVTVDGVSLTVNRCRGRSFDVTIIPHTAERTLLGGCPTGVRVNLEADVIGKYVHGLLRPAQGGTQSDLLEQLRKSGFLQENEVEEP